MTPKHIFLQRASIGQDQIGKIAQKMSENCVFGPSGQFSDIFRTFLRHFSNILSTFRLSGLSNDCPLQTYSFEEQAASAMGFALTCIPGNRGWNIHPLYPHGHINTSLAVAGCTLHCPSFSVFLSGSSCLMSTAKIRESFQIKSTCFRH